MLRGGRPKDPNPLTNTVPKVFATFCHFMLAKMAETSFKPKQPQYCIDVINCKTFLPVYSFLKIVSKQGGPCLKKNQFIVTVHSGSISPAVAKVISAIAACSSVSPTLFPLLCYESDRYFRIREKCALQPVFRLSLDHFSVYPWYCYKNSLR